MHKNAGKRTFWGLVKADGSYPPYWFENHFILVFPFGIQEFIGESLNCPPSMQFRAAKQREKSRQTKRKKYARMIVFWEKSSIMASTESKNSIKSLLLQQSAGGTMAQACRKSFHAEAA